MNDDTFLRCECGAWYAYRLDATCPGCGADVRPRKHWADGPDVPVADPPDAYLKRTGAPSLFDLENVR